MTNTKPSVQSQTKEEIALWVKESGQPSYRAGQIFSWVHEKQVDSFDDMTNLPKALREALARDFEPKPLTELERQCSKIDGTNKFLFELADGETIESVFMPYKHGNSVCVSSQVGCAMGCVFCASTVGGRVRDLTCGEMLAQVYAIQRITGEHVSNVVVMGMGEPLENVDEVIRFIRLLADPDGQNMSMRHITVSTCGIIPGIERLEQENLPITLALSLHAATQEKRVRLMPVSGRYPLDQVLAACDRYRETTGRRMTYEYALIEGVSDTDEDVRELTRLVRTHPGHVNLIPVNDAGRNSEDMVAKIRIRRPAQQYVVNFQKNLEKNGINGTIRREMGSDIDGACGQLKRRRAVGIE